MITYLLVVGPIAGFLLGVFVTTMCMSAREGDRGMVDLSGAAARGDLDSWTDRYQTDDGRHYYPTQGSFVDEVGRHVARERTER